MTFNDILHKFRSESFTQKDKGTQFERLMRSWLLSDPRYSNLTKVWLWDDFPSRADLGGKDTGIDLVARTEEGDYWAIQCKCYKEDSVIDKPAVDSFLATSSRQFKDPETLQTTSFAKRMWISTTNHWGKNAEDAIQNQNPPFNRVGLVDLQNSPVDWQLLIDGLKGKEAMLPGKQPREHQLRAMSAAHAYFQEHDRGKLIMACGTGKTYTALKIAEDLLNNKGLVLFMVPSISLLGQSLNAWCADAVNPIKGICICSDSRASRKIKKDFDDTQDSVVDLAVPATTNPKSIAKQLKLYRNHNGLTVVFSTYQSIEAIHAAQHEILKETAGTYGKFDLIVCDEAHRTTGVKLSDRDESNFTKIHDAEYIKGNKRLYMTATPRLYGQSAKIKASEKDAILCSMDDPKLYGEEFFRVNFSYAVEHGLLTDYKVLVLTVNEDDLPDNILSDIKDPNNVELNFDDTSKLIGIVNGLSKIIRGDKNTQHGMQIQHSVNDILKREFNTSLSDENVHILDPFTGTGTFITRLLQSGLIKPEDMERKYRNEIHCNEIVLLAYYIADVNIEAVYHDLMKPDHYVNYDGICLTDTFQLAETKQQSLSQEFFKENSEGVLRQKKAPIRVIIGNPPYSIGQKSANDNAANMTYPVLDKRVSDTYAAKSSANLTKALYDSYIKAFRWATDRIADNSDGGIVAFISNGSWLDGNAQDGFRACLESEFTDIYVLNLRGNQRTSGELSRKEGGKIFGGGSRTPITITILVKNPAKNSKAATIHYHDIGDYLTREQKLNFIKKFKSVHGRTLDWEVINPTEKHDWINQRDGIFDQLIPVAPEKKFKIDEQSFFSTLSLGIATNKDTFLYDFSKESLCNKIESLISFYNSERMKLALNANYELQTDPTKIVWTDMFKNSAKKQEIFKLDYSRFVESCYRPFTKQNFIFQKDLIQRTYQQLRLFPTGITSNKLICVSGIGVTKDFSCIITDQLPDLELIGKSQCFPLYWYEERKDIQGSLFDTDESKDRYKRHDGITDWILKEVRKRFGNSKAITKEHIFYYVYGILHSPQYRERFAADLKKSLPRIPIVDNVEDFMAFYKAGKALADLHLNYEQVPPCPDVTPKVADAVFEEDSAEKPFAYTKYSHFFVDKMTFPKVRNEKGKLVPDKSRIIYNDHITIENIPAKAYEYIVNGKSAIEWIMERYAVSQDSKSLIINDPNEWSREHKNPTYIYDLLLSVINLSVQTVDIVNSLPKLKF